MLLSSTCDFLLPLRQRNERFQNGKKGARIAIKSKKWLNVDYDPELYVTMIRRFKDLDVSVFDIASFFTMVLRNKFPLYLKPMILHGNCDQDADQNGNGEAHAKTEMVLEYSPLPIQKSVSQTEEPIYVMPDCSAFWKSDTMDLFSPKKQSLDGVQQPRQSAPNDAFAQLWKPIEKEEFEDPWRCCREEKARLPTAGEKMEDCETDSGFSDETYSLGSAKSSLGSPRSTRSSFYEDSPPLPRSTRSSFSAESPAFSAVWTRSLGLPLSSKDPCFLCNVPIEQARFNFQRRYGLLNNCDHVFCYPCLLISCNPTSNPLIKSVMCPQCGTKSDAVATSTVWKEGDDKRDFFSDFIKECDSFWEMIQKRAFAGLDKMNETSLLCGELSKRVSTVELLKRKLDACKA